MDSRFYKKDDVKYLLYPQNVNWIEIFNKIFISKRKYIEIKEELSQMISNIFETNENGIFYYSCASKALEKILYILSVKKKIKKVYIPDFSCMELADTICRCNCEMQVYDIADDFKPSIDTIKIINEDKHGVLILPSFFGKNQYSDEFLDVLSEMDIPIIFDEAQAFPNVSTKIYRKVDKCAIIISFGKSKPISSIGGGAVINKELIDIEDENILKQEVQEERYIRDIMKESRARVINQLERHHLVLKKKKKLYSSLEELVWNKMQCEDKTERITKLQIIMAYYRLIKFKKTYLKRNIKERINFEIFGDKNIIYYDFLPLKVDNSKRYETMRQLGEYGVQCTIYYYPLHLIPFYNKRFNLNNCINSKNIFEKIIIVPFGIDYSNKRINKLIKILNKLKKE